MRHDRRAQRFRTCALTTAAAVVGTLAFTGSALAATFNATNETQFESAIASANSAGGANTINLATGVYSPAAQIHITAGPLTIQGPTPTASVNVNPAHFTGGALTTPAPGASLFVIPSGVTVNFNNIDITTAGSAGNGVIDNSGTVNINQSTITGQGPGLTVEPGATSTLLNSTISDGLDVGIIDDGTLTLTNSTITRSPNGGIDNQSGVLNLVNSIVAKNGSPDCTGPATTSDASLDGDGTCGVGALSSKNPLLGAIALHGGDTPVDVPGVGSPAIGAGDPAKCPAVDERNATRPSACDLGAVQTDTVKPVLTNSNIQVASANPAGTVANFTATWTDAGSPVSSSCSPASGSTFPVGQTTVTCTGTDAFGNTNTGTFVVTDVQATPPTVTTTPSGTETVAAVNASGATATFTASATDTTDGTDPVTCVPASGSQFPLGPTTVTCSATDSQSLTGTATLTVDVTDQTAPVITVPSNIVAPVGTPVTYTPAPSATDNVDGTDAVTCSPASGSSFSTLGPNTVTCTAKDAAGNTATKSFTVTATASPTAHANVQGEVGSQLSITVGDADFGPFIPGVGATYNVTDAATVTSTDTTAQLFINDVSSAATTGHLVNGAYSLVQPLQADATSSSPSATGSGVFGPVPGPASPFQLLGYTAPVTNDSVTVGFRQVIGSSDVLHNGTYAATVLLSLTGTP